MPTVNIFYKDPEKEGLLSGLTSKLKDYIAGELTCGEIKLKPDEVSIRFLRTCLKSRGTCGRNPYS